MRETARWQFAVGLVFGIAALALIAISFATDEWIATTVDRTSLKTDLENAGLFVESDYTSTKVFFTRNRGLFRTCYSGNDTLFLDSRDDVLDGKCLREKGYEFPDRRESTTNYPSEYEIRIHLMRTHVACFILSMVFYAISILMGLFGIYKMQINLTQVTGLLIFAAAFLGASGMAFFHGYDYIEKNEFDRNLPAEEDFYSYWSDVYPALDDNSDVNYGYSYILGWLSVGLGAISGVLFICAAVALRDIIRAERKRDRKEAKKEKKAYNEAAAAYENAAYNAYNPYAAYQTYDPYAASPGYDPYAAYAGSYPQYPAIGY